VSVDTEESDEPVGREAAGAMVDDPSSDGVLPGKQCYDCFYDRHFDLGVRPGS